ncbi:MAG: hypothetical protein ABI581_06310 [Sediminibacterium sp.]
MVWEIDQDESTATSASIAEVGILENGSKNDRIKADRSTAVDILPSASIWQGLVGNPVYYLF